VEFTVEETQTEKKRELHKEVQVKSVCTEFEMQTDEVEVEVVEVLSPPPNKKRLSIVVEEAETDTMTKESRGAALNKGKAVPATAKADSMRKNKIDLTLDDDEEIDERKTPKTSSSSTLSNTQVTKDYLKNRDPMKEFFQLVRSSIIF
jgi:hypothetical protein